MIQEQSAVCSCEMQQERLMTPNYEDQSHSIAITQPTEGFTEVSSEISSNQEIDVIPNYISQSLTGTPTKERHVPEKEALSDTELDRKRASEREKEEEEEADSSEAAPEESAPAAEEEEQKSESEDIVRIAQEILSDIITNVSQSPCSSPAKQGATADKANVTELLDSDSEVYSTPEKSEKVPGKVEDTLETGDNASSPKNVESCSSPNVQEEKKSEAKETVEEDVSETLSDSRNISKSANLNNVNNNSINNNLPEENVQILNNDKTGQSDINNDNNINNNNSINNNTINLVTPVTSDDNDNDNNNINRKDNVNNINNINNNNNNGDDNVIIVINSLVQSEDSVNLPSKREFADGTPNEEKTPSPSGSPKAEEYRRKTEYVADTTSLTFEEPANFSENEVIIKSAYYGGYEECGGEGCEDSGDAEEGKHERDFDEIERNPSATTSTQVDPMQFGRSRSMTIYYARRNVTYNFLDLQNRYTLNRDLGTCSLPVRPDRPSVYRSSSGRISIRDCSRMCCSPWRPTFKCGGRTRPRRSWTLLIAVKTQYSSSTQFIWSHN